MSKRVFTMLALCVLALPAASQQARRTPPPQPNYQQYGSYSRQLTVYNNVRMREEQAERNRIRRIRTDLERRERARRTTYIVSRGRTARSGDTVVIVRGNR